jgi:hypothetical protein
MSPVVIVGLVLAAVALFSLPSLLALSQHGVGVSPNPSPDSVSTPRPALPPVETTQCTLNATRTLTAWTGTARATDPLADVTEDQLRLSVVLPDGSPVGSIAVTVPPLKSGPNKLGEIEVVVHGAPAAVSCQATLAYSTTR